MKLTIKNLDTQEENIISVHAKAMGKQSAKIRKEKYGHDSKYYKKLSAKAQIKRKRGND